MKLVSIIMPVYNAQEYVARALESLVGQTYKNIEILAIDDGSTDGSLEIMSGYAAKDKRVKVITQANAGCASVRNIGLAAASGEYIMFCDADDWYNLDMVERMISAIERPGVDFAVCLFNIDGDPYDRGKMKYLELCNKHPLLPALGAASIESVFIWDKIFKKSVIDRQGVRFPDTGGCEDALFFYEYRLVAGDFYILRERLYNKTMREDSMWNFYTAGGENKWSPFFMLERLAAFLDERGLLASRAAALFDITKRNLLFARKEGFITERQSRLIIRRMNYFLRGTPFVFVPHSDRLVFANARTSGLRVKLIAFTRGLSRDIEPFDKFRARMERGKPSFSWRVSAMPQSRRE